MRPEFLNRIDEILIFKPLSRLEIRQIVDLQLKQVQKRLDENGITLEVSKEALDYIGKIGYDPQFGARPLKRVVQREILNELSKEILAGKVTKDAPVGVVLEDGKIAFVNSVFEG